MALAVNRQSGQVISASDINNIATFVNNLIASAAFVEAVQDVLGAMVQAAGGGYVDNGDGTGSITLPTSGGGSGATINDTTPSRTTVFSSTQVNVAIQAAVANLVNGSSAALDTLNELANALGNNPDFATSVATALAMRVQIAGGVTSILSRTKTQGLPSTVVNGQLVVIPV